MSGHAFDSRRALLEVVVSAYSAIDFPRFAAQVVGLLSRCIPADLTILGQFDMRRKTGEYWLAPQEIDTAETHRLWRRNVNDPPLVRHYVRTRDPGARTFAELTARPQWRRTGMYNELYRLIGIEDGLGATLEVSPPKIVAVGFHRRGWGVFKEKDRNLLDILRPHLIAGWKNIRAFQELRKARDLFCSGLESLGVEAVMLDRGLRPQCLSRRARLWLERYFGIAKKANGLPELVRRWAKNLEKLDPDSGLPAQREPLRVVGDAGQLTLRLLSGREQALLLLREESLQPCVDALRLLGLTQREAEVLSWVAQGKTNGETACILGLSRLTVKRHVESILKKLQVETRTGAAAIAHQMMFHPGPGSGGGA